MSELRVAVAMGGGVSLGSFCGGALGEVARQLLENRTDQYESVRFDVFSGASAGAMSVGLMVHTLAHPDFAGDPGAVLERQREAWVKRIDIRELVPDPRMTRVNSLLDRGAVDRIARDLLSWESGARPRTDLTGPRALMACTLANLNGIPVNGRKAGQGEAFLDALQTTLYQDLRVFDLRLDGGSGGEGRDTWVVHDDLSRPSAWEQIAGTCVAAGGFPMAFEPVALERTRDEYGPMWPDAWKEIPSFPFTFADGGMFNNEPLREVMDLIGRMDAEEGDFERLVIFIDPNLSGTAENLSLDYYRELEVRDPDNTLWKLGRLFDGRDVEKRKYVERITSLVAPLVGALRGQAAFKDWLGAEKVNNRLSWRGEMRELVVGLVEMIPDETFRDDRPGAAFTSRARDRLKEVLTSKKGKSVQGNAELFLGPERDRIRREAGDLLDGLSSEKEKAVVHLFSLLDQVAGLRARRQVRVLGIGPVDEEGLPVPLAGDFFRNFGGFFSEGFRAHDFDVGRAQAGKLLANAGLLKDDGAVVEVEPLPTDPTASSSPQAERLLERIKQVAGDFLDVRLDWPLKLDKVAISLAKGKLGAMIGKALEGEGGPVFAYVARVEIVPGDPEDRFKLEGFGGGDSLDAEEEDDAPVIETLVFYAPEKEDDPVSGPHVTRQGVRAAIELVHNIRFKGDESRRLALPGPEAFEELERLGYGKLTARVDWAELLEEDEDALVEIEWEPRETLRGWG